MLANVLVLDLELTTADDCGMVAAMKICNLTQQGQHHHALADALNVARLLPFCPRQAPAAEG
jgi:inhibitor of KinA sporulation pathway (predicted exonuclease)